MSAEALTVIELDAQFTKGPWLRLHDDGYVYVSEKTGPYSARYKTVAFVHGLADARLIAAAPELYEALTAALAWAETIEDEDSRHPRDELGRAYAALAKARGEQP